jgi:hypothetical protein
MLLLLLVVAAIAVAAPNVHAAAAAAATGPLDARGIALLMLSVIVIAVEGVRRLP